MNCHESQLVNAEGVLAHLHYHMMTGSVNWAIALGRRDIQCWLFQQGDGSIKEEVELVRIHIREDLPLENQQGTKSNTPTLPENIRPRYICQQAIVATIKLALVFDQALAKNRTEKDSLTNQVSELKEKLEDLAKALAEARKALSEARARTPPAALGEQLQAVSISKENGDNTDQSGTAQMESTFANRRLSLENGDNTDQSGTAQMESTFANRRLSLENGDNTDQSGTAQMESTFANRRLLRRGYYDGKTIPHWLDFGRADYNHPFSTVADPRSQYEKGMDSFKKGCRDGNGDIQEGLDFLNDQLTAATPRTTGIPRFDKAITVLRNGDAVIY
jgi:hypothetical protein